MTPAIAVAILAFAVGLQAQPVTYNDAAIIARSAQPEAWAEAYAEAYADAYADAKLEAREAGKVGEFVTGAIGGIAANTVANQFGHGTSNMQAALLGGGGNVVAHSAQFQKTAQRILGRDAVHRLAQRDTEAIMYQLELQRRSHLRDAVNY